MVSLMPKPKVIDENILENFEDVKETVTGIRNIRKANNIAFKEEIKLFINKGSKGYNSHFNSVLIKLCNLSEINFINEDIKGAVSFLVKTSGFFIELGEKADIESEILKLEEELNYTKGFLKSVLAKLNNEKFVNSAPEKVVEMERKKKADAEDKIKSLEERISAFK
jgi:valyl-tRNA synthetase